MRSPRLRLRWKWGLLFFSVSMALVLIFTAISAPLFTADKRASVLAAQAAELELRARDFKARLELERSRAQTIFTLAEKSGSLSTGDAITDAPGSAILAMELWDETKQTSLFRSGEFPRAIATYSRHERVAPGDLRVSAIPGSLLLDFRPFGERRGDLLARVLIDLRRFVSADADGQALELIGHGGARIFPAEQAVIPASVRDAIANDHGAENHSVVEGNAERYFVTSYRLGLGDLRMVRVTREQEALGPLATLRHRTLLFTIFALTCLLATALLATGSAARRMAALGRWAAGEREDETSLLHEFASANVRDEIDELAGSLLRMSADAAAAVTKKETETIREVERRTLGSQRRALASEQFSFRADAFEISGQRWDLSGGGSWHEAYVTGEEVTVFAACGDGANEALDLLAIESARTFARICRTEPGRSLSQMMELWETTDTHAGRTELAKYILRLDVATGVVRSVSRGHREPYLFIPDDSGTVFYDLADMTTPESQERSYVLGQGTSLVVPSVTGACPIWQDGRLGQQLSHRVEFAPTPEKIGQTAADIALSAGNEGVKSMSFVVIHRPAQARWAFLADEMGDLKYRSLESH